MARQKRQSYSATLKGKVAMEALREAHTVAEIASKHKIHPTLVTRWKGQAVAGLPDLFADGRTSGRGGNSGNEEKLARELYEQIGRLKMENDWLKKKLEL
jgi:transposase